MQQVKINRLKLLEIMEANRETHITEYNEAMIKYREAAIAEMKANLKKAQKGGEIDHYIGAEKPQSYESNYDTVINMLKLSDEETVMLSAHEFQQYVEDEWGWKGHFNNTVSTYAVGGAMGAVGPKGPRGEVAKKLGLRVK